MIKGILTLIGVLLIAVSAFVWISGSNKAKAGTQSYAETYTPTEWRNFKITRTAGSTSSTFRTYALGPSKWSITGSFGNSSAVCDTGEQCFNEIWTATGWNDTDPRNPTGLGGGPWDDRWTIGSNLGDNNLRYAGTFTASYETSATAGSFNGEGFPNSGTPISVNLTGMYGLSIQTIDNTGFEGSTIKSFRSTPTGWNIAGTVTTNP